MKQAAIGESNTSTYRFLETSKSKQKHLEETIENFVSSRIVNIIFDTIEFAAILIFPVKVLSKRLSLSKVSPLIKTRSTALYNIDELSINKAVIERKINNFKKNPNKINYLYVLTPKGISEKTKLTLNFMKRKMKEYDELKKELE